MKKSEVIAQINLMSAIAVSSLNAAIHLRGAHDWPRGFHMGTVDGLNTSAGFLAKELKLASMTWDKPKALAKAA